MGVAKGKAIHKEGQSRTQRQEEINRKRRKEFSDYRIRGYLGIDKIIQSVKIMTVWY